jgi:hypothetical protein
MESHDNTLDKLTSVRETINTLSYLLLVEDSYCPVGALLKEVVNFIDGKKTEINIYDFFYEVEYKDEQEKNM